MRFVFRCLLILLGLIVTAAPVAAQLTVITDRTTYTVGDVVGITIHNAGSSAAMFNSYPAYALRHLESGECLDGCMDLPLIWWLQPGETILAGRNTAVLPDPPGHYRIQLAATSIVPGSVLSAEYALEAVVGDEAITWSRVKGLYR